MTEFLLGLLCGFLIGGVLVMRKCADDFDNQYDKALYEWKLNKEKQNDTTKN